MADADSRPWAVLIMGPTASGKTDLAVELVRRLPVDIISVDSAMVYRGLDIGAAKPDPHTLAVAPHRLIDILDPVDAYSAGRFRKDALAAMAESVDAERIPLLVGGTMLYFRALLRGLAELPQADPALRSRLEAERAALGTAALHDQLRRVDPLAAARIHPNDPQRIQRALEVFELTGQPLSERLAQDGVTPFPYRVIKLILAPTDRPVLHRRIEQRFQEMLEQGFVAEVERLRARGDLGLDKPAMRAVGYRQVWEYLDGLTDHPAMVRRSVVATRRFAKRQLTWLRAETGAVWQDSLAPGLLDRVLAKLEAIRVRGN